MLRSLGVSLACLLAGFTPAALGGLTGRREDPRPTSAQVGRIKVEADMRSVPISGCVANKTNFVCQFPLSRQAARLVYTLYDKDGKRLVAVPITNAHVVQADKKSCTVRLPFGRHADAVARLTITHPAFPAVAARPEKDRREEPPARLETLDSPTIAQWRRAEWADKVAVTVVWLADLQRELNKPVSPEDLRRTVASGIVTWVDLVAPKLRSDFPARDAVRGGLYYLLGKGEGLSHDEIIAKMMSGKAGLK